ncbi:4Fe-4S binding protein [bacterium]|nr:4Fe-4S binding protein [candidate division CSSED10-310 bacterium]
MSASSRKVKEIRIRAEWCKGCGICVYVCPKNVFEMNRFKAIVARQDDCIVCGRCEEACPDFCLEIIPDDSSNQDVEQ